jgi:Ca2+/Na+ antiporter
MDGFPLPHVIALLVGGLLIWLIKKRYRKMRTGEVILIFVLYAVMVVLFTEPIVNLIRNLVG